jgi:O-antigen ligase
MLKPLPERLEQTKKIGELLVKLSAVLLAVAIPTSVALDNVAVGIAILGIILLGVSKALPLPPLKPLLFLIAAQIPQLVAGNLSKIRNIDPKQYAISYIVGYVAGREREFLKKIAILLGISTIALTLALTLEAVTGQNIKHLNPEKLRVAKHLYRAKGFLDHPLTTGGVLFSLLIFHSAMLSYFREKKFAIFTLASLIGIVLTQSRSYWIGVAIFSVLIIFSALKVPKFRKAAIAGVLLITAAAVPVAASPELKSRLISITDVKKNNSNKDRLTIWLSYYYAFKNDYSFTNFIFGAGERAKELAVKNGKEACLKIYSESACKGERYKGKVHGGTTHNIYLKYFSMYGIVGLIAYLAFWGFALWKNAKEFIEREELFPLIFLAGYTGFLAAGLFENNFTDAEVQTAILFTLGVNFALLSLRSGEKPPHRKEG